MNADLINDEASALARLHCKQAIGALVTVLRDPQSRRTEKIAAAAALLERGYGKPRPTTVAVPPRNILRKQVEAMSDADLLSMARDARAGRGEYPPGKGTHDGTPHGGTHTQQNSRFTERDSRSAQHESRHADQDDISPSYARIVNSLIPDMRDLLPESQIPEGDDGEAQTQAATTVQLAENESIPFDIKESDVVEGEYTPAKGTHDGTPTPGDPWD